MLNFSITVDSIQGREAEYRLPAMVSVEEAFWKFISIAMDSSYEVLTLINDDDEGREESSPNAGWWMTGRLTSSRFTRRKAAVS